MEAESSMAVPMRFYANWDTYRASNFSMPRAFSMILNHLTFSKSLDENSIVISLRLQGHKRALRSNDILLCSTEAGIQVDLDISFIIQYSHFLKRKANAVELLIQRRKKYKNRQIPGFKTLGIGIISLDEVLQFGGAREVKIISANMLAKMESELADNKMATISVSHCQTVAVDSNQQQNRNTGKASAPKETHNREDSEDDGIDDESTEESDDEGNYLDFERTPRVPVASRKGRNRKKNNQKNIKQRLVNLLKRFKVPDEGNAHLNDGDTSSIIKPTAKELEEIFEELENTSDSGPDVDMDKLSIQSNPRPGLHRPYFGSKTDILPVIDDNVCSDESESDEQESSDLEVRESMAGPSDKSAAPTRILPTSSSRSEKLKQSTTNASLSIPLLDIRSAEGPPPIEEMLTRLDSETGIVASNVWLCSSADFPWISRVDFSKLKKVRILDCPNAAELRAIVQNIISRIQKFCNTNSVSPTQTVVGIYGTDRHVSHLLQAYVDFLRNKPTQDWTTHLRFVVLCPPASALGRLLSQAADTGHAEASWRALAKVGTLFENGEATSLDLREFEDILTNAMNAVTDTTESRSLNFPIGEVMLQLNTPEQNTPSVSAIGGSSQLFVPFLSEIHLGSLDALNSLYFLKGSLDDSSVSISASSSTPSSSQQTHHSSISPPASPHLPKTAESREMHLEYWTCNSSVPSSVPPPQDFYPMDPSLNVANKPTQIPPGNQFTVKASFKTLSIARESMSGLLSIQFVKERRKDKMLQKLGRKKNVENFVHSQARVVANVSRLICSGTKNSDLEISIDGVVWQKLRFFQVTSQWQTHVKLFPISVPSPPSSGR